jgi:archaemetzincin
MAASLALALVAAAAASEPIVDLVPLGTVEPRLLEVLRRALEARVHARVRLAPPRELPRDAFYARRNRWRAEVILELLEREAPEDAWRVVGVTEAELSTTKGAVADWGIAGFGGVGGKACVVSSFLYRKHSTTRAAMERRFADIAVHEFGHTLGMEHCGAAGCVMADARGKAIRAADRSTGEYCPFCRARVFTAHGSILKPRR